ncbi:PaaX family transcriptional regulator [Pilimelia columellifera]|uniref:Phenylacetic acid degradation operon negative regulatory protein PaaX n=1 Tax=Pilimelia columellifera subsp. columellifera TaxID=706583 RepID=A0ABN3NHE3_9ACTN
MQARSALFDLYGDHLRPRGGRAPVAALVRLLQPLGITGPAVRTAISRMARQGWLRPVRLSAGPGYALSDRAARRLDDAAARIYRTNAVSWNGQFDLVIVAPPLARTERRRLAAQLAFLGYGALSDLTWVAARPGEGVDAVLAESGLRHDRLTARHAQGARAAARLVDRAWDLPALSAAYRDFQQELTPVVTDLGDDDVDAYAARFQLVHAWRSFLFRDPALPPTLLPADWAGVAAATFFGHHAAQLRPAADRYVDRCLTPSQGW